MDPSLWIVLVYIYFFFVTGGDASVGDRSWFHQKCFQTCFETNCTDEADFKLQQPLHLKLLLWDCPDECKYECMWSTVDAFQRDGSPVPQFHGKWPFIRIFGVQEPASVFFSVLNALSHLGLILFRSRVPKSSPLYYIWHGAAAVAVNAWTWSVIFHTRDTNFTEKMDYFFAFSLVLYTLFGFLCRTLGTRNLLIPTAAGSVLLLVFLRHVYYMGFVKFDYGYNMTVNLAFGRTAKEDNKECSKRQKMARIYNADFTKSKNFGVLNGTLWLIWCGFKYKKQRYVWKCATVILSLNLLIMLELLDFPPLWWTFDAHSLWHAGTAPFGLLWYSFIIDDCLYLQEKQEELSMKLD